MFHLKVIGPDDYVVLRALADTGATATYLDTDIAKQIGVSLTEHPHGGIWRGTRFDRYYARVGLAITDDDKVTLRWDSQVFFWEAQTGVALFGQEGGLLLFDALFSPHNNSFMLTPNADFFAANGTVG